MLTLRAPVVALVGASLVFASCGGGGGDGGSATGACEEVSAGPSKLTVNNTLGTGVRAYLPQFAFGSDMFTGECNVVGLDARGTTSSIRVELTRCNNSFADSDCTGKLVAPTHVEVVNLPQGGAATLVVTAAMF